MVGLLSSIVLFGLESLGRLEIVVNLEQQHLQKRLDLKKKVQEQWDSLKGHCAEWPGEHSIRLIGFSPDTLAMGEKNGRYFYEISLNGATTETAWMVVTARFPLMDLLSEGQFSCS